ncbi:luciferase family oxidoreductase group 1 [Alkalihalobacillus xiaoxiensis]|uniref:Luciferase family oxidoreductase group 1 n=2 Tax=Shouchella xiaoxiensis TaxID=766895 RepID=A0ABS2SZQ4_9BACI|nr:luciferase family oxidoreductase group 1 [Shouchella xiaoxiensis]
MLNSTKFDTVIGTSYESRFDRMKLSILDQVPRSSETTNEIALKETADLALAAESLGYSRYWIAEHHDLQGLLSPTPEILLAYIGAKTNSIRLGAGAILLPHYAPYKVAESFNMLSNLFPGRVDLGLGRSPGGSAEASEALSGNFIERIASMDDRIEELMHFIRRDFPSDHRYHSLKAAPVPFEAPAVYMLGTSKKSADLAAKHRLNYVYGHFMNTEDDHHVIGHYRSQRKQGQAFACVSVLCADTTEKARELYRSVLVWQAFNQTQEPLLAIPTVAETAYLVKQLSEATQDTMEQQLNEAIVGDKAYVKKRLDDIAESLQLDELMVLTHAPELRDRLHSYRLLTEIYPQLVSL